MGQLNTLFFGDCMEMMKEVENESVDCMVTDAPYGISFMSKKWDIDVPSVAIWKECLRVLKPGSFTFVMSSPRQDVLSKMICNLHDAGFDTHFTSIYWCFASGFPKAMNISKAVDRKLGVEREIISGESKPLEYSGKFDLRSSLDRPKDSGAVSDEAKELDGSYAGFQPKPAVEIIIVAMKPLSEKSYTDQALKNKKGVTWLDDVRVPTNHNELNEQKQKGSNGGEAYGNYNLDGLYVPSEEGRFPANLIVSDDVLNDGKIYSSGEMNGEQGGFGNSENVYGDNSKIPQALSYADSGSFSRFYDLDKWWEERIKTLPENVRKVFPFLIEPKAAKSEKNVGCELIEAKIPERYGEMKGTGNHAPNRKNKQTNVHPTVKPIKLMSYLIVLGSREGDVILEPFAGSGTTCIAAHLQNRNYIASEINKEYYEIAVSRIKQFSAQQKLQFA